MWWAEAGKYVLPLDDRFVERALAREMNGEKERTFCTFYPGTVRIPEGAAAHVKDRSHSITAEIENLGSAEAPICAIGGVTSGWSLYIKDKLLTYCYNYVSNLYYVRSKKEVPSGNVNLRFEFEKTGKEKFGAGVAILSTMIVSASASEKSYSQRQLTINGEGATFPFPFIDTWRVAYQKVHPNVNIYMF